MPAPPQVQVFHFTSRISSAKIRKYKLATERGMAGGSVPTRTPTPTSRISKASPSPSVEPPPLADHVIEPSSMEPPTKKPRLKLSVRPPSQEENQSPDNITVSRPRRDSSLRIRYSENMSVDEDDTDSRSNQQNLRPSPTASSDLSSVSSRALREPTPVKEPTRPSSKPRDYGKDFMSYYVTGGDEDDDDDDAGEAPPPKDAPSKPEPAKQAPAVQPPAAAKETKFKHHQAPVTNPPAPPKERPPRPPPPQPVVQLVDTIKKAPGPREPDTVAKMVKKLETLSTALTNFGGVPPVPASPTEDSKELSPLEAQPKAKSKPASEEKEAEVDDFLAMFDDEDSDGKDDKEDKGKAMDSNLDYHLPKSGELDGPLTYGIQFIQNALKSWAQQRLQAQAAQQAQQDYIRQTRADSQPKRGPGRPRKFDDDEHPVQSPPTIIQIDVMKTPEGAAIAAFQDVLDSGCLQVNAVLPAELTTALRHLYMQIDHLINQGARNEPPWQCMSYGAQITAHKIRVEKWKEAHAKAQEEMARQQQLAQQQVMQQMGIQPSRGSMTAEQAQHAHAVELERRRSLQHAAQQPHLTRYLTNPLSLDTHTTPTPTGAAPSPSPVNGKLTSSPATGAATAPTNAPSQSNPADGKGVQLDKIKLYMPNYLPRSGQSMKFSFAPHSELALKAFGAQAFPTGDNANSNLPNRGPMIAGPTGTATPMNPPPLPNGSGPPPTPGANTLTQVTRAPSRSNPDTVDIVMSDGDRRFSQAQRGDPKPILSISNGSATVKDSESNFGKFIPLDGAGIVHHSSSTSAGSPNSTSAPKTSMSNGVHPSNAMPAPAPSALHAATALASGTIVNEKTANLVSRFPYPGAVILDK